MPKLGIFFRFALRRTWLGTLCVMGVIGVFEIRYPFRSPSATIAAPLLLGIFIAIAGAIILWNRNDIPYDEIVDSRGNYKPCPRCGDVLFETLAQQPDNELMCGGCGVAYCAPKDSRLTHSDYGVILPA